MELDFSGLNSIAQRSAQKDGTEPLSFEGINFPVETEKPPEAPQKPQKPAQEQGVEGLAQIRLKREQEDHRQAVEMYGAYQTNIKRAGQLRTDIMKGVRAGDAPQALLLKAVECIALMTGNQLFYDQIKTDLKAIWGEGFLDPIPLEWALGEVEERIANMEKAVKEESTGSDSRARIERALQAHYQKRDRLKTLLENSTETMRAGA